MTEIVVMWVCVLVNFLGVAFNVPFVLEGGHPLNVLAMLLSALSGAWCSFVLVKRLREARRS